jgi:hypothetical protein
LTRDGAARRTNHRSDVLARHRRDSFDWLDITVGMVRALAGLLVPAANRQKPS